MPNPLARLSSPWGLLELEARDNQLSRCNFVSGEDEVTPQCSFLSEVKFSLNAYFSGEKDALKDTPLFVSGSAFQRAVWHELRKIPFAETRSYGNIAQGLERANSARAVGGACRANKILLFIPCHRVIAGRGNSGGFNAGPELKRQLLSFERQHARVCV